MTDNEIQAEGIADVNETRDDEYSTPAQRRAELHARRMEAVRQNSPAVQDGPYAYLREDPF